MAKNFNRLKKPTLIIKNHNLFTLLIRNFGWLSFMIIMVFIWKQSLNPFSYSNNNNNNHPIIGSGSSNGNSNSKLSVDAFFFDKFERLKRITLPSAFVGLSSLLPGLSSGIRVCINFNSQYPQGYQQVSVKNYFIIRIAKKNKQ